MLCPPTDNNYAIYIFVGIFLDPILLNYIKRMLDDLEVHLEVEWVISFLAAS